MGALTKSRELLELVKFEHTLFALPFALTGAVMAAGGYPDPLPWILLAVLGGRTFAMALNRIIDRRIDGLNPRTAERAIPAGRVALWEAWALAIASLALMVAAVLPLPPLCLQLLPVAVLVLAGYSYTKRFTWACHLVLGTALGMAAAGGWIAVTGAIEMPAVLLGVAVTSWVAGFDIIYACQDESFDRTQGLHSLPVKLGVGGGLRVSRWLHALTVTSLTAIGLVGELGPFYWIGVLTVAGMLIYEQSLVKEGDLSRVNLAFFNLNGYVSLAMLTFTTLNYYWSFLH